MNALRLTLCLVVPALSACATQMGTSAAAVRPADLPSLPVLVRQSARAEVSLQALFMGHLHLDPNGCLRGRDEAGPLIIWHHDTRMDRAANGRVRIVDTASGSAVHVGDEIALSGGQTSEVLPASVVPQIPPACQTPGGYFIAGSIMGENERQRIFDRQRNRPTAPAPPEAKGTRKDGA